MRRARTLNGEGRGSESGLKATRGTLHRETKRCGGEHVTISDGLQEGRISRRSPQPIYLKEVGP